MLVAASALVAAVVTSLAAATGGADFNGDKKDDIAVYRPSTGYWYVKGAQTTLLGQPGDLPVSADYDGDGKAELAVFRPSNGNWYGISGSFAAYGMNGDRPVPADYTRDGRADVAVFRPSDNVWYVKGIGTTALGQSGDVPVPGDYDGDCRADIAVFRPSNGNWYGVAGPFAAFGLSGDIPVPADYNGDGKDEVAVYRPSNGVWYVKGQVATALGISGDVPVPGDYDGDGKAEAAVFRPSNGTWYGLAGPFAAYGMNGDVPVRAPDVCASAGASPDSSPPSTPTGLKVSGQTQSSVTLTWTASSDNVAVTGYGVYRDGVMVASPAATSQTVAGLVCGTTYSLGVDATDGAGNRSAKAMVGAVTAACSGGGGGGAPGTTYVSTAGSDTNTCMSPAAACKTFDRAYRAAQPGWTVEVAGGTYPAQGINRDSAKAGSTNPVTIRPAAGATVTINCSTNDCISAGADYLTVESMRTTYGTSAGGKQVQGAVAVNRGTRNVSFVNIDAGHVWIAGDNARIIGGDYGPQVDEVSKISSVGASTGQPVRNTLIDGAYFHDYLREASHMECLNVESADGLVLRNSRFNNCAVFAVIMKEEGASNTMRNITIENNFFSNTAGIEMSNMVKLTTSDSTCDNVLIRNNSIGADDVVSDCPGTNIRWESNILRSATCGAPSGTTWAYNVVETGSGCGGTNVYVPGGNAGYVNRAAQDLHLTATSYAIGRGRPDSGPATDIDGQARPQGTRDAGADER